MLRRFGERHGVDVVDLDDPVVRESVEASPSATINERRVPICIDEYQKLPEILDAIKARLNREPGTAGMAVITGSTRHDALPTTAQALTGRLYSLVVWPLSQVEIEGTGGNLLTALRHDPQAEVARLPTSYTDRTEYLGRICAGGFPLALERREASRNRWFDSYVRTSLERDAADLADIRQRQLLFDLLGRYAAQTAQVLNINAAASALEANRHTVEQYTRLLEDLFLIVRLPAWGKTLHTRATARPKLHLVDSGVGARLLRVTPEKLSTSDPTVMKELGHLVETFVVTELWKQASWLEEPVTLGHWRTRDGVESEVDLVVEFDDGGVLGFEVKTGERVLGKDLGGLRRLRDTVGDRFIAGVALSMGPRSYTYEDRLHIMPIDRLWR